MVQIGGLHADYEISLGDVAVGHSRSVIGEAGVTLVIEKNQAAGGVGAFGQDAYGFTRGLRREVGHREPGFDG